MKPPGYSVVVVAVTMAVILAAIATAVEASDANLPPRPAGGLRKPRAVSFRGGETGDAAVAEPRAVRFDPEESGDDTDEDVPIVPFGRVATGSEAAGFKKGRAAMGNPQEAAPEEAAPEESGSDDSDDVPIVPFGRVAMGSEAKGFKKERKGVRFGAEPDDDEPLVVNHSVRFSEPEPAAVRKTARFAPDPEPAAVRKTARFAPDPEPAVRRPSALRFADDAPATPVRRTARFAEPQAVGKSTRFADSPGPAGPRKGGARFSDEEPEVMGSPAPSRARFADADVEIPPRRKTGGARFAEPDPESGDYDSDERGASPPGPLVRRESSGFDDVSAAMVPASTQLLSTINLCLIDGTAEQLEALGGNVVRRRRVGGDVWGGDVYKEEQVPESGHRMAFSKTKTMLWIDAALAMYTDQIHAKTGLFDRLFAGRALKVDIVTVACGDGFGDLGWAASAKLALEGHFGGQIRVRVAVLAGDQYRAGFTSMSQGPACAAWPDASSYADMLSKHLDSVRAMASGESSARHRWVVDKADTHSPSEVVIEHLGPDGAWVSGPDEASVFREGWVEDGGHRDWDQWFGRLAYTVTPVEEDGRTVNVIDVDSITDFKDPIFAQLCASAKPSAGRAAVLDMLGPGANPDTVYTEDAYRALDLAGTARPHMMIFNYLELGDAKKFSDLVGSVFPTLKKKRGGKPVIPVYIGEAGYSEKYLLPAGEFMPKAKIHMVPLGMLSSGGIDEPSLGIQFNDRGTVKALEAVGAGGALGAYLSGMPSGYYVAYTKSTEAKVHALKVLLGIDAGVKAAGSQAGPGGAGAAGRVAALFVGVKTTADEVKVRDALKDFLDSAAPAGLTVVFSDSRGGRVEEKDCWGGGCGDRGAGMVLEVILSPGLPHADWLAALKHSLPVAVVTGEASTADAISFGKVIVYDARTHKMRFWRQYAHALAVTVGQEMEGMPWEEAELLEKAMLCAAIGDGMNDGSKVESAHLPLCIDTFVRYMEVNSETVLRMTAKLNQYIRLRFDLNRRLVWRVQGLLMNDVWNVSELLGPETDVNRGSEFYDILDVNCATPNRFNAAVGYLRRVLEGLAAGDDEAFTAARAALESAVAESYPAKRGKLLDA